MSTAALLLSASGLSMLGDKALAQSTAPEYPSELGNPFTLGVASGDPLPDGVVLWTRLAPSPLNGGGMTSSDVKVRWEVWTGGDLAANTLSGTKVQQGEATARPGLAHSVHVEVSKLNPGTRYYYRFTAGTGTSAHASSVGRTKTAPASNAALDEVRFAMAACQSYQAGYWAPFLDIAEHDGVTLDSETGQPKPDLDFVVHVGDYIYEYPRWTGYSGPWRLYRTAAPTDLATYRNRHAEFKYAPYEPQEGARGSDYGLQKAHAAHPWICTWDDHEVVNDYAGGDLGQTARRNAAYQAYYEHMPIRPSRIKTEWSSIELYHDIAYGNLARVCVLDTRQYRSKHACKTTGLANCSDRLKSTLNRKQHTILGRGDAQENWLKGALSDLSTTWKVLPNQVRMMGFDHDASSAESYRMEEWDGYVATRNRISQHIAGDPPNNRPPIKNVVSVTGDVHCAFAANLRYHPTYPNSSYKLDLGDEKKNAIIGAEIIGTSACSDLSSWWKDTYKNALKDNPHVKYLNTKEGGFVLCTVKADSFEAKYRVVIDNLNNNGKLVDGRYSPLSKLRTVDTATVAKDTATISGLPSNVTSSATNEATTQDADATRDRQGREKAPHVEPPRGQDTR